VLLPSIIPLLGLAQSVDQAGQPWVTQVKLREVNVVAVAQVQAEQIVDVGVSFTGNVYVLRVDGIVETYQGGSLARTWGGRGAAPGKFMAPEVVEVGPRGRVHVYDRGLNAVTVFDSTGGVVRRAIVPEAFRSVHSIAVDRRGSVYLSGSAGVDRPVAQVYEFCARIDCPARMFGASRQTNDTLAHRFFQGGMIQVVDDRLWFVGRNPFRLLEIDLDTGDEVLVSASDLLPDGEALAFQRLPDDRIRISNAYPRSSGLVVLPNQNFIYSAVFPREARSVIQVLGADGSVRAEGWVEGLLRLEGAIEGDQLVMLRRLSRQEVVIYSYSPDGKPASGEPHR
jgi:hypothetical protein